MTIYHKVSKTHPSETSTPWWSACIEFVVNSYLLQDFQRNIYITYRFNLEVWFPISFPNGSCTGLSWRGLLQFPTSLKLPQSTHIGSNHQSTSVSHATNIQDIVAQCLKHNTPVHRGWRQTSCRQGPGCEWHLDSLWSTSDLLIFLSISGSFTCWKTWVKNKSSFD